MKTHAGSLDGLPFSASLPFVVLDWPNQGDVAEFDSAMKAWQFLEKARGEYTAARGVARLYEFSDGHWRRLPPKPSRLALWENSATHYYWRCT